MPDKDGNPTDFDLSITPTPPGSVGIQHLMGRKRDIHRNGLRAKASGIPGGESEAFQALKRTVFNLLRSVCPNIADAETNPISGYVTFAPHGDTREVYRFSATIAGTSKISGSSCKMNPYILQRLIQAVVADSQFELIAFASEGLVNALELRWLERDQLILLELTFDHVYLYVNGDIQEVETQPAGPILAEEVTDTIVLDFRNL